MGNDFKNKNDENLAVLIPAHNEEKTICSVITKIKKYLDSIIIVNDGSTDNTQREAERAGAIVLRHNRNLGKGAALKTGFDYILENFPQAKAVITLDADGQHNPDEIEKFIEIFKKTRADLILGERIINQEEMPFLRRIGNEFFSWLISKKIGRKISDSQSGFRLLSRKFLEKSNFKSNSYGIETEILLVAAKNGFQIKTLPISTVYLSKKNINFLKDFKIIISILKEIF